MKKTYSIPVAETYHYQSRPLCIESIPLDDNNPVGGSKALTRCEDWYEE
ncbi:MAG: hypothetical protein IJ786_04660 [Bacteroidaceae bacterium]|nr:hypothetical protein [Bacteroidaceae bacterium]